MKQSKVIKFVLGLFIVQIEFMAFSTEKDVSRESLIFDAVQKNDMRGLSSTIKSELDANLYKNGISLLYLAAMKGHAECVALLVNSKADVNTLSAARTTALHLAAWNGHLDCLNILLKHGADINLEDLDGQTACDFAISIWFSLSGRKDLCQCMSASVES